MTAKAGTLPGGHQEGGVIAHNLACFIGIVLWSFAFPANDVLLETWGAISLALARIGIGVALLSAAWAMSDGFVALAAAPWWRGMWIGGFGFGIGTMLLTMGQDFSDAVTPAIAVAMMPVAGALVEVVMDRRRLRVHVLAGIALALLGGYLATGVRLSDGNFGLGALMCLAAVFLFAWATRMTTNNLPGISALGQTSVTLIGAMVAMALLLIVGRGLGSGHAVIGDTGLDSIVLILIASVPSLTIAQLLWIWSARRLGILLASMHMNALPFYVMVIIVVVLDEPWGWDQAAGAALVAAGVVVAQLRRRR